MIKKDIHISGQYMITGEHSTVNDTYLTFDLYYVLRSFCQK